MSRTLPEGFVSMIEGLSFGPMASLPDVLATTEPSVAVRANAGKEIEAPEGEPVAWLPGTGRYLDRRPQFTLDPLFHQGGYYVQDASSMFIGHVVWQLTACRGPVSYLDACAAPGGKTACALDALPAGSVVVANEAVPQRAAVLRENIVKWGNPGVILTRADARSLASAGLTFDIVAADVPCSGEGMMRKEPEAIAQWSPRLIKDCAALQRAIVDSLWECVAPGGYLIYSTCTFNTVENEAVAAHIADDLGGEAVEITVDPSWGIASGIATALPCYRFIPGRIRGEGLFMTVMRKPDGTRREAAQRRKSTRQKIPAEVAEWTIGELTLRADGDRINAFPTLWEPLRERISSTKGITAIHDGIVVATLKGHDIIPAHSLAMSTALNADAFAQSEVDRETALSYLRAEALRLDGAPRGYLLLTFGAHPLGFVKNLGNRANNLYPRDYRILHL